MYSSSMHATHTYTYVRTVTRLLELKTRVRLKAGSEVDLCCLVQLLIDWSGICIAVLNVVKITSGNWFVLAVASY